MAWDEQGDLKRKLLRNTVFEVIKSVPCAAIVISDADPH
jgi:hypothetical protein